MKKIYLLLLLLANAWALRAQLNMTELSNVPYPEGLSSLWGYTAPNGVEYAIVGTRTRTSIVSLANPAAPVEVASVPGPTTSWREVKVWGNYAYVGMDNVNVGYLQIDLSNLPTVTYQHLTPTLVINGVSGILRRVHTVTMDENGYMYLNGTNLGGGAPLIFDVHTNPGNPIFLGAVGNTYSHDCMVRGDTLWSGDIYAGRFSVWNVANKQSPQLLATQSTPNAFTHNVWPSADGQTVFTTDEVSNAWVTAYDVSDLGNITELDRWRSRIVPVGSIPHNVHLRDDYIVTAHYTDGVYIVDGHRPTNMIATGFYDTHPGPQVAGFFGCWGVYPYYNSGIITASDMQTGLHVLQPTYVRACYLEGVVTDAFSCQPINGVSLRYLDGANETTTNISGAYAFGRAQSGAYPVEVSKPGYVSDTVTAVHQHGVVTIMDVALMPLNCASPDNVIFVNDNAIGTNDGSCWANAYRDLQLALAAAVPGQQIWVAQGIYKPTSGTNRSATFHLKPGVSLYGGFPDGNACTLYNRNPLLFPTFLSGEIGGPFTNDNSYRVVTASNVGSDVLVDGFTIKDANSNSHGGGAYITASGAGAVSNPTFRGCRFTANTASLKGGGAFVYGNNFGSAGALFDNCTFDGNVGTGDGGGIGAISFYNSTVNVVVNNSEFQSNTTPAKGGAICTWTNGGCSTTLTVFNSTFDSNTASLNGGAVFNYTRQGGVCSSSFTGCDFGTNTAASGSAIFSHNQTSTMDVSVELCTFTSNTSTKYGPVAAYTDYAGETDQSIYRSVFTNNTSLEGGGFSGVAINGAHLVASVARCRFENNTGRGGGIFANSSGASSMVECESDNNVFFDNQSNTFGGGFSSSGASSGAFLGQITNCTFVNNAATNSGAAIYNTTSGAGSSSLGIVNTIFKENTTAPNSRTIHNNLNAVSNMSYSFVDLGGCANAAAGTGTFVCGPGNLDGNPLFVNMGLGDLHLTNQSPCINTGTAVALTEDYDGMSRPVGGAYDMGAYEFNLPNAQVLAREAAVQPMAATGAKVYPNPSTGYSNVVFPQAFTGAIHVRSFTGGQMASILVEKGVNVPLDLSGLPSGTYLLNIVGNDGQQQNLRMVLVK